MTDSGPWWITQVREYLRIMSSVELVITQSLPGHILKGNQNSSMGKVFTICNKWGQCGLIPREQNPEKLNTSVRTFPSLHSLSLIPAIGKQKIKMKQHSPCSDVQPGTHTLVSKKCSLIYILNLSWVGVILA